MAARRIAQLIPSRSKPITLEQSGVRPIPYGRARKVVWRALPLLGVALAAALVSICALAW